MFKFRFDLLCRNNHVAKKIRFNQTVNKIVNFPTQNIFPNWSVIAERKTIALQLYYSLQDRVTRPKRGSRSVKIKVLYDGST